MGIEPVNQRVISINVNQLSRNENSKNNVNEKPISFADAIRLLDSEIQSTNGSQANNTSSQNRSWTA